MKKFVNNYSIMWGMGRYEIRLWRKFPWKLEFIDYGPRAPLTTVRTQTDGVIRKGGRNSPPKSPRPKNLGGPSKPMPKSTSV